MGRYIFRMPDVGEGVAEAEIIAWHVKPGDPVAEDQSLVDVMTDKATVDMTAPVSGTVVALHGEVGEMRAVGSTLVELEVEGEGNATAEVAAAAKAPADAEAAPAVETAPTPKPASAPKPGASAASTAPAFATRTAGQAPLAAPATRRRAHELGIALQYVPGSGPGGRITPEDLDRYVETGGAPAAGGAGHLAPRSGGSDIRIVGMRRKIAEKMQEAKRRIPHITYVEECDLTELEALRADLNAHRDEDRPKLTLLPFFVRALARALPDFPQINARYDDDQGILHQSAAIHLGIATQTPAGLLVPVIRHAEALDVWACAQEIARLSKAARDGSATREEMSGATITITSLGTLGGITATPIVNHPEVAIIGPNKLVERPVVQGSFVTVRKIMNLSSSFDHRIVDGYDAALFVQRLKRLLEHPALMFMD
ncbi:MULTISPECIES: dihydrolipoamide acetyltransferase family protein [unclassified Sphingomonas]|uniref:dihydrolipoamide acetyltransferase family protein n=1 Tax=unclassified Sphingomonas TaxID=196159 RepID=UPI0006F5B364|nr:MULTISPECIES: dihydrolipoamide acetyltransferase family protein [unclassified Sphingomonas]KQX25918.1 branched-chain alpha-keto acid dehydrogenase subunit E2 [Sphingomonas sp. Root1294]KQY68983.1 branched-chain alpha-keto acid dehydrogenase subunit E2 [Sphingomonas sp. Root50]KRB89238.1 branched-chain alpha-keto acid dehydrogenase subunit E2 [Sphingomonas sp. Root720]